MKMQRIQPTKLPSRLRMAGRAIMYIPLIMATVHLAAQPALPETTEAESFFTATELEQDGREVAEERDREAVEQSMTSAELVLERDRYKDLSVVLSRDRWILLLAGIIIGSLISASMQGLLGLQSTAGVTN